MSGPFARRGEVQIPATASRDRPGVRWKLQEATGHLVAGVSSGLAGLLAFLILHHIWIRPIWFILPVGLIFALPGGAAAGWAYHELEPYLPPRWRALILAGLIFGLLAPAMLIAEVRDPMLDETAPGSPLLMPLGEVVVRFVLELVLTATLAGCLIGWLIARRRRAVAAMAIAGVAFALGPGHNIPFLGGTSGALKGAVILMVVVLAAALTLVGAHQVLANGRQPRSSGSLG